MRNGALRTGHSAMIRVHEVGTNTVTEAEEVVSTTGRENVHVLGGMFSVNV